jgi:hypothetical protein
VSSSFVVVYAHVVGAILVVGYCLFWAVMTTAARRQFASADALRFLRAARSAAWPLPGKKPTLALIGWLLLIFVAVVGVLCLPDGYSMGRLISGERFSTLLSIKLVLSAALVACFPWLGVSRVPLAIASLGLALAVVVTSTLLVR